MSPQLSERQFFILSLSGLALLMGLLYAVLLRPGFSKRAELRREIDQKTSELLRSGFFLGETPLLQRKAELERERQIRLHEWRDLRVRMGTFADQDRLGGLDVRRIDYQFQLYAVRVRLRRKARDQSIDIPALLGLPDEIGSDAVARELYMQLLAVESLVDTSIEYGIADIRSIDLLPPVRHTPREDGDVFLEEYPLRITFEGDMPRLYRLWEAMFQTNRAMMLRNIAMEKTDLARPDQVRMTATLSALLFVGELEDIAAPREQIRRSRPRPF